MRNRRNRAGWGSGRRSTLRVCRLPVGAVARPFLDAGGPSLPSPQVIELGAPDLALPRDFQRLDQRGVQREDALDADPGGNPAHGEIGGRPGAVGAPDAHPLKGLHALAGALPNAEVNPDGIAGTEFRDVFVYLRG